MKKDEFRDVMTPRERIEAMRKGRPYDRIPCNPSLGDHAARVTGIKVAEYHLSAVKMAEAQIAAYRTYGHDGVGVGPGSTGIAEAAGCKVAFPEQSTPYIAEHVVKDYSDLFRLTPPDPRRDGRFPVFLEALEILVNELGKEVPVSLTVGGPVSTAANLRGVENFLRDLYYHPEFAHELLRFALDSTIPLIKEAAKLGVKFGIVDPVSSGSLISPKQYREFAFPYQKEMIHAMKEAAGSPPMLHICGNTKKIWLDMAATGAGALSLDNVVDLAEAKQAVGDRIVLTGNIRPTETMYLGTPDVVAENVKECLRKAYDSPKGFILAMGCGLPIDTPPENLHALLGAARKYGRYPLNPEYFS
ncbi:MAG TPA: uroporphyrinogen decarboxylase [Pelotomaculum sp.]|nr:uroporphyrinogen decarboxylase [Pelotomaculum sp.]